MFFQPNVYTVSTLVKPHLHGRHTDLHKREHRLCLPPCQLDGQYTASGCGLLWAAQGRLEESADRLQRSGPQRQGDGQDQVPRHAERGDGVRGCQEASSLGRYVFGSEISYNKPPPRLPGLGC
jgi:hypothetical protein